MYPLTNLARVAAIAAALAVTACSSNRDVLGPNPPVSGAIFKSYVAIGNSLTAGYQSSGINDSTQRQSYARLLATQMGTQYHYAALAMPGCPGPTLNFQTGARVGGTAAPPCALRVTSSITDVLNNVAVPDARVLDPVSTSAPASNAYTTLILGGKTQVQRALDARPTFVSIWIGNNDVLNGGYTGILTPTPGVSNGIVSTQAQFQTSYDLMLKQLLDSMPQLKGILIGVAQIGSIPLMTPGAAIFASPAIQAGINQVAGKPVAINPNCSGSSALVTTPLLLAMIRAGTHPAQISCVKGVDPTDPRVGELFVLDAQEGVTLAAVIDGYNAYIKAKADALGFAFYDPNALLGGLRGTASSSIFPNYASTTAPFGTAFSFDGIHPSLTGQKLVANALITTINTKYGTSLQPVP
ncbi:MAG TPA: SGNH/GDSL hydrolase family protein [Gemmatimonadaceae bacterium]|nr:SGNH/GDSL hydrolase family protein [Gemmatimonadaceae bacterium]